MKHIIKLEELKNYSPTTMIASSAGRQINIRNIIQEDNTAKAVFEVAIKGKDCYYTDFLDKAIKEYNT